jgi:hypothetical protein
MGRVVFSRPTGAIACVRVWTGKLAPLVGGGVASGSLKEECANTLTFATGPFMTSASVRAGVGEGCEVGRLPEADALNKVG